MCARKVTGDWRPRRVGEFTGPQNAQTADVREPEPRPAAELPILRNNVLVPRPGSSATRLPCRRRSGSWPTLDLHYGVREDLSPICWCEGDFTTGIGFLNAAALPLDFHRTRRVNTPSAFHGQPARSSP